ncbi:DUF1189 family protein [Lentisphaerota bacterium ZTH]|nr:DUF1189 family protein [Lentisphaerota bacterium]WET06503.1 DUF1189 family protein [Lentisphaerota bacterium ZTH]
MNFISAISGVCKGTSVFLNLMRHSLFKALLHLILFSIACAIMITVIQSFIYFKVIDTGWRILNQECGEIRFTPEGILPGKQPEKMRFFSISSTMSVLYLPAGYKGEIPDLENSRADRGIIWTPSLVLTWGKTQGNGYIAFPFIYNKPPTSVKINFLKQADLIKYVKDNMPKTVAAGTPGKRVSAVKAADASSNTAQNTAITETVKKMLTPAGTKLMFVSFLLIACSLALLAQALLFVSIFSLIFNLIGSRRRGTLKLRDLFVVGIYTSLPPLLIASAYTALELPFLSFNTVFLICFTVYLMYVVSSLENRLAPPPKSDAADF